MSDAALWRVGVLGAYGEVGRAVVRLLARDERIHVVAAGRRAEALDALVQDVDGSVEVCRADAGDADAVGRFAQSLDVLINTVGPYLEHGVDIAAAAAEQGVHYIDVSSEQEHYRRLRKKVAPIALQRSAAIIPAAGLYPGVSGILLAEMLAAFDGTATYAEVAVATGVPESQGAGFAELLSGLHELTTPLEDLRGGELVPFLPKGEEFTSELPPPFGERPVIAWPNIETLRIAELAPGLTLKTGVSLAGHRSSSPWVLRALRRLRPGSRPWLLALMTPSLRRRHRRAVREAAAAGLGIGAAGVVTVGDATRRLRRSLQVRSMAEGTAALPVLLASRILAGEIGERGLALPMDLLTAEELSEGLLRLGLDLHIGEITPC